jgi:formylglycine-generating enzyme required for sulfatase activity
VGQTESFIASKGTLNLAVLPGDYQLRISAPHHIEQIVELRIQDKASAPEIIDVELKPAWTDIVIGTEPGASISVIDARGLEIELGVAGEDGIFSLKKGIFAGTYHVLVEKEGYKTSRLEDQSFEFATESQIKAPLTPLPARLSVSTQPPGAVIAVNDVELGTTPLDLDDIIPDDQYLIVARLEGYRPIARRIEVAPGAEMAINFGQLVPLSGALGFELSVLGNHALELSELYGELTVFLDWTPIPFGDKTLNAVPVGKHRVHLEHPLYTSNELTVNVQDKGKYALKFDLSPRPALVQLQLPGNLVAVVRINGQPVAQEGSQVQIPANQPVEFELRVRNYLTMMRTFELSPNESFVWQVNPVPIPGPVEGQSWTMPYFGIRLVWIPAGQYGMGSPLQEHARLPNEGPQTSVRFTRGFWAGVYEVTQAQYLEITNQNPSEFINPAHPVENVTWEEAKVFCSLLTDFERDASRLPEGYVYRLPSEAEWEYVARAGTRTPFFFGTEADASMGHFRGVYPRDRQDGLRAPDGYGTARVGRYQANAYGLYDVHGNVREWTLDRYNGRLEGEQKVDPRPRTDGSRITVRGGGWEDSAARVRSAVREEISPDVNSNALGFRVVLAPK